MSTDYGVGGPYEISPETLAEMMTRRFAPRGKGDPVRGIDYTEPNPGRRTLTLLRLSDGFEVTARIGFGPYTFSQQSMSKPSAACYLMELLGHDQEGVRMFSTHLGNRFSGLPYNGPNIDPTTNNPYNYSDNIGALKVWKLIVENTKSGDPFANFYTWFCRLTGTNTPSPNLHMAEAEYIEDGQNWRLLERLGLQQGTDKWRAVYSAYCRACGIKVTSVEAATVFAVLANRGLNPRTKQMVIWPSIARHVYDGMSQHGAYDESVKYAVKAGLASKTGVDGAIMGQLNSHPDFAFCGQHSDLNFAGNSGEVLKWIVDLSRMHLEWPDSGVRTYPLPPNVPTGEALDKLLQRLLKPTTRAALQARLDEIVSVNSGPDDNKGKFVRQGGAQKAGFYLKLNPKNKPIDEVLGDALLTEGTDLDGVFKRYYFMPDTHSLHKVLVERVPLGMRENLARRYHNRFG
jgi:glutaminase